MKPLLSKSAKVNPEDCIDPIVLDVSWMRELDEKSNARRIDVATVSIDELSSFVVSKLITDVRKDLANIKVASR